MKHRVYSAIGLLLLTTAILFFAHCKRSDPPASKFAVQLQRQPVPVRVFSIAGEVLAFEATGEAGRTQQVPVSLKQLQSRFGPFERVSIYEYSKDGKILAQREAKVGSDQSVTVDATTGNRYLLYPDLGGIFSNSYVVACSLGRARISGRVVPRICNQIFCGDQVFRASELKERVPELKSHAGLEFGDGLVGGFEREGSICDQCRGHSDTGGDFIPTRGCSDFVHVDQDDSGSVDVIVFARNPTPNTPPVPDHQIYKINSDGTGEANLSNNAFHERSPDVHHRTRRIVFVSTDSGITTMDLNGGNRTAVPNTIYAANPKWNRTDEPFIIYVRMDGPNNAIHRVRPDGSDNVEIVSAGEENVIRDAEVVDDNHIIFTRVTFGENNPDIYIKDIRANSDPVNLTNTPDVGEVMAVVSHDGQLIAYIVRTATATQPDEIHIARLTLPGSITVLHRISLAAPAGRYLTNRSLDFSSDDRRVYVSSTVIETQGTSNLKQLFSIRLDGTGQYRLTVNDFTDLEPSVVAR